MEKREKTVNEEKKAAASYVINFYNEVTLLNHEYANYENIILYIKGQTNSDIKNFSTLEDHQKNQLMEIVQTVRYYINKTYLIYNVLIKTANQEIDKEIQKLRQYCRDNYIIDLEAVEDYVLKINLFLTSAVMKNLLENSEDYINKVFANENGSN